MQDMRPLCEKCFDARSVSHVINVLNLSLYTVSMFLYAELDFDAK